MRRVDALRRPLELASADNFAGVRKVVGLGHALRAGCDGILARLEDKAALELWRAMTGLTLPRAADPSWVARIGDVLDSDEAKRILSVAAVQQLQAGEQSITAVVSTTIVQLQARTLARHITDVKSKLQRTNPVEQPEIYNRMFGELIALEEQHRALRDRAIGA